MTAQSSRNILSLALLLTIFLFLCSGLHTVFACGIGEKSCSRLATRVDSCHLIVSQKPPSTCCQSEACHETALPQRDLGSPEYHTRYQESYPLVRESHRLTPQPRISLPLRIVPVPAPRFVSLKGISQAPLQQLDIIRTVVLLN